MNTNLAALSLHPETLQDKKIITAESYNQSFADVAEVVNNHADILNNNTVFQTKVIVSSVGWNYYDASYTGVPFYEKLIHPDEYTHRKVLDEETGLFIYKPGIVTVFTTVGHSTLEVHGIVDSGYNKYGIPNPHNGYITLRAPAPLDLTVFITC